MLKVTFAKPLLAIVAIFLVLLVLIQHPELTLQQPEKAWFGLNYDIRPHLLWLAVAIVVVLLGSIAGLAGRYYALAYLWLMWLFAIVNAEDVLSAEISPVGWPHPWMWMQLFPKVLGVLAGYSLLKRTYQPVSRTHQPIANTNL